MKHKYSIAKNHHSAAGWVRAEPHPLMVVALLEKRMRSRADSGTKRAGVSPTAPWCAAALTGE